MTDAPTKYRPFKPQVPSVTGDPNSGAVIAFSSKYSRDIALMAVAQMGGADGLVEWAQLSAANEADFWTKIFPKTITKEVVIDDRRTVVDLLRELDAEDAVFTMVQEPRPAVSPTDFAPVTVGVDDGEEDDDNE